MLLVSVHAGVSSEARGLRFNLSIHTQNFGYASGVGSGENEPSLLAEGISTKLSCSGRYDDVSSCTSITVR